MQHSVPKVIVYSDYICPFCFIGKSRIDRLRSEFEVDVEWRNIEIHPETPIKGIPRTKLDTRFFDQIWFNVERLAEESGVGIRAPLLISNSSLAMIASEYARQQDRFDLFHDAVFRAYWQQGQNIGEIGVLLKIGETVGLDPSGLKAYIKGSDWATPIEENRHSAEEHLVSGVPTFIIGEEKVVGAQPYEVAREALLKSFTRSLKFPGVKSSQPIGNACGDACGPDSAEA